MMTFHPRLKRISKPKHTRLKFGIEKLKDPSVLKTFQAIMGGKFASLTIMNNGDTDMGSMITTFNTAVRSKANVVRRRKIPWVTAKILDLRDKRREFRRKIFESEGSKKYKEVNHNRKRCVNKQKKTG